MEAGHLDESLRTSGSAWGMATLIVPYLSVDWNGYSAEEVQRRSEKRRQDALVAPCFAALYLLLAACVTAPEAGAVAASAGAPSSQSVAVRVLLAAGATYVLAVHCVAFPAPTATQDDWKAQSVFGRWVYLTRHCVALQAWHQVLSLVSLWVPGLTALTHGISVWIATLGWFVTVQYFVLVVPSQPFKDGVELWRTRGVQFKEIGEVLHAPALPMAVLDLLVAKNTAVLHAAMSWPRTVAALAAYVLLYLSLLITNHRLTGLWAYGLMKALGTYLGKWAIFVVGQVGVLLVFLGANAGLFFLKTVV